MSPQDLVEVLKALPEPEKRDEILVGLETPDDAGVYRLSDELALVQTVDFFTPIVDDPYMYGQIAAANSLSDVYAMGGRPVTALNLVSWPVDQLPKEWLAQILKGGADKLAEAGVALVGGHSIDDAEPKYGLAVTGTVHPEKIIRTAGARPGDMLVLTKPIGAGSLTTAIKRGEAEEDDVEDVTRVMAQLNRGAGEAMQRVGVSAATDVTGFGLLGHAQEMAAQGGVSLEIEASKVPMLPGALRSAVEDIFPGGSRKNFKYLQQFVTYENGVGQPHRMLLCDAVTSGGLLIAVAEDRLAALLDALRDENVETRAVIGRVVEGEAGRIRVLP